MIDVDSFVRLEEDDFYGESNRENFLGWVHSSIAFQMVSLDG